MITTFRIEGMTSDKCTAVVRKALEDIPGIEDASPDLATGVVVIVGQNLIQTEIVEAIERAGYKVVG
jgi:copper chaperone CopZ